MSKKAGGEAAGNKGKKAPSVKKEEEKEAGSGGGAGTEGGGRGRVSLGTEEEREALRLAALAVLEESSEDMDQDQVRRVSRRILKPVKNFKFKHNLFFFLLPFYSSTEKFQGLSNVALCRYLALLEAHVVPNCK